MLMRFDPFRELDRLTDGPSGRRSSMMGMDAYRDGDHVTVHFDLPGIDPASIDVTVEKNQLTVRAERRWELAEGQELIVAERAQGTFSRSLFLGDGLDPERIEASYEDGVLTLTIPVAETAKPRRITVGSGH
ncbi:MAG TPA: Hsp20/alpha crystallin family protein [Acidimicrobiales bacterium]|nr:Hsp20/alpha crystallin family protein [Acidimicrobiales bacterium]